MKKLIAMCSVFLLVIGATSCSSDDNVVRNDNNLLDGVWVTDKLSYKFGDNEKTHDFSQMGDRPSVDGDRPSIVKETMTIIGDKVTLVEETKQGEKLKPVLGTISKVEDDKEIITFDTTDAYYTPRTLLVSPEQFALMYNFTMSVGQNEITLPVTVTYIKK